MTSTRVRRSEGTDAGTGYVDLGEDESEDILLSEMKTSAFDAVANEQAPTIRHDG